MKRRQPSSSIAGAHGVVRPRQRTRPAYLLEPVDRSTRWVPRERAIRGRRKSRASKSSAERWSDHPRRATPDQLICGRRNALRRPDPLWIAGADDSRCENRAEASATKRFALSYAGHLTDWKYTGASSVNQCLTPQKSNQPALAPRLSATSPSAMPRRGSASTTGC